MTREISTTRRWSMLIVSTTTTLCATVFINGVVFLIPALKAERHMSLAEGALWSAMPSLGMAATLFAWGYLLDRIGERIVLTVGLALTAAAAFAAASVHSMLAAGVLLLLGGMAAASSITASGRLVTGWFPPEQRGVVMGLRQTAQPLGIALAALVMPELAKRNFSLALLFPAVLCAVAAVASAVGVLDPPRSTRQAADDRELANPYRGPKVLWRIHVASALLVVPQNVVLTFMLVWLIGGRGWSTAAAGGLLAVATARGISPHRGRPMVGPHRFADATDPGDRHRHHDGDGVACPHRSAGLARRRGGHARCGSDHRRQRVAVHRDPRIRRAVLERTRAGCPAHR